MALLDGAGANIRALVVDIHLGPSKLTGWDVARHAREKSSSLPVVYISAASGHDWASLGVPRSVLVPKPLRAAQVVTAVSRLLNIRAASSA
jgi:CheY-like chemotaxis protein